MVTANSHDSKRQRARLTAVQLIASKEARPIALPDAAKTDLRLLLDHNDACAAPQSRVGFRSALRLLQGHGVVVGERSLDRICREHFGRKSWARS